MAIICFDYGHGGKDPGAVYKQRREKDDNLEIGMMTAGILRKNGVQVHETRSTDKTISLDARCNFENKKKYDYFISFHRNAYEPEKARGVEIYTHINGNPKAKSLAGKIQKSLVNIGFADRGLRTANFKVLRGTVSPALLIELGFIDNTIDNELFIRRKVDIAQVIGKSILDGLHIESKELNLKEVDKKEEVLYRVISGSFNVKSNADKRVKDLKDAGFDSYLI